MEEKHHLCTFDRNEMLAMQGISLRPNSLGATKSVCDDVLSLSRTRTTFCMHASSLCRISDIGTFRANREFSISRLN
jgi:hypothetical protein